MISYGLYASIGTVLLVIILVGVYSARLVKSSADFIIGGRKLGALMVCGGIVGAFAGGTVTVGTAQMAFKYGISGLWFTLGAGAACLVLSLFLAGPMREKKVETVSQFLSGFYGGRVAPWVALFIAAGMYIQLAVQMLAAAPLLTSIFPVSPLEGLVLFAFLSAAIVLGGGFMSTTLVGFFKLLLMAATYFAAGSMSWGFLGGFEGLSLKFADFPWFSMFPRGMPAELAGWMSVVVGFVSTQSFIQPVFAGKDVRSARTGSLMAALVLPLFGLAGVTVGMYMRTAHPDIDPAAALPLFMLLHQPAWLGGVGLATLLVSLVITASALALGVSTLLCRDIYLILRPSAGDREQLLAARLTVFAVVAAACLFSYGILGDLILDWTYLSNALRGVTVFLPMVGAVFFSRNLSARAGIWAVTAPPLVTIAWAVLNPGGIHPLYAGLPVSLLIMLAGVLLRHKEKSAT
ncbi:MAG: sodium:solute symporter family protein [Peptococcaceae bacterium]|nr:sodium:solute symporter family protein [Peptococcaceae bacterium]